MSAKVEYNESTGAQRQGVFIVCGMTAADRWGNLASSFPLISIAALRFDAMMQFPVAFGKNLDLPDGVIMARQTSRQNVLFRTPSGISGLKNVSKSC